MSKPSELDQTHVMLAAEDLPLHCPLPSQKLWNTHPRVFLPIAPGGEAKCPYCGTVYSLPAGAHVGGHH
jgi:uncharacterized Zn-finger protein